MCAVLLAGFGRFFLLGLGVFSSSSGVFFVLLAGFGSCFRPPQEFFRPPCWVWELFSSSSGVFSSSLLGLGVVFVLLRSFFVLLAGFGSCFRPPQKFFRPPCWVWELFSS